MILRFVIEPEMFKDLENRGDWPVFLQALDRFWRPHGVWIIPNNFDQELAASGLAGGRISEWKRFVTHEGFRKQPFRNKPGDFNWASVQAWADLSVHTTAFDLALLQEARAAVLDLVDDSEFCKHDPAGHVPIEIARGRHVLFTCKVEEINDLAKNAVPLTDTPDQIWETRFRTHVRCSSSVMIVDKYAARKNNRRSFVFVLNKLMTDGWQDTTRTQTVNIYSTYSWRAGRPLQDPAVIKSDITQWANAFTASLNAPLPNVQINIHLLAEPDVKHDRWIRAGKNIIELGKGLAVFEHNRQESLGFLLKPEDKERDRAESSLASICKSQTQGGGKFVNVFVVSYNGI